MIYYLLFIYIRSRQALKRPVGEISRRDNDNTPSPYLTQGYYLGSRTKEYTEKAKEEECNRSTATLHSYTILLILKKKHSNLRLRYNYLLRRSSIYELKHGNYSDPKTHTEVKIHTHFIIGVSILILLLNFRFIR